MRQRMVGLAPGRLGATLRRAHRVRRGRCLTYLLLVVLVSQTGWESRHGADFSPVPASDLRMMPRI